MAQYSLNRLEEKHSEKRFQNEHVKNLQARLKTEMDFFNRALTEADTKNQQVRKEYQEIYLELLEHQRQLLDDINQNAEFDEEIIRKYQFLVDMEEYKARAKLLIGPA